MGDDRKCCRRRADRERCRKRSSLVGWAARSFAVVDDLAPEERPDRNEGYVRLLDLYEEDSLVADGVDALHLAPDVRPVLPVLGRVTSSPIGVAPGVRVDMERKGTEGRVLQPLARPSHKIIARCCIRQAWGSAERCCRCERYDGDLPHRRSPFLGDGMGRSHREARPSQVAEEPVKAL